MELVQEGNCGLLKAIDNFDLTKEVRFATYAVFWIEVFIFAYIQDNLGNTRILTTQARKTAFFHLGKAEWQLEETLERKPTSGEIAKEICNIVVANRYKKTRTKLAKALGEPPTEEVLEAHLDEEALQRELSPIRTRLRKKLSREPTDEEALSTLKSTRQKFRKKTIASLAQQLGRMPTSEEVEIEIQERKQPIKASDVEAVRSLYNGVSLDQPVASDSGDSAALLGNFIPSKSLTPEDKVVKAHMRRTTKVKIDAALDSLPERERRIIILRQLVPEEERMTLQTIGDMLGISRERVRQLEVRANKRMKAFIAEHYKA